MKYDTVYPTFSYKLVFVMLWTHKARFSWINIDTSDFSGKKVITSNFREKKINQIHSKFSIFNFSIV